MTKEAIRAGEKCWEHFARFCLVFELAKILTKYTAPVR